MTPYYIAPPLILALVLTSKQGGKRFWSSSFISLEITVFAYHHLNPWAWWLPIVIGLAVVLTLGYPNDISSPSELHPSAPSDSAPIELLRRHTERAKPLEAVF